MGRQPHCKAYLTLELLPFYSTTGRSCRFVTTKGALEESDVNLTSSIWLMDGVVAISGRHGWKAGPHLCQN